MPAIYTKYGGENDHENIEKEMQGEIHRGIGVLKRRLSSFEKTLREVEIDRYGLRVSKPLTHLRGILGGIAEGVMSQQPEEAHYYEKA